MHWSAASELAFLGALSVWHTVSVASHTLRASKTTRPIAMAR